jgi:hypothetical protein
MRRSLRKKGTALESTGRRERAWFGAVASFPARRGRDYTGSKVLCDREVQPFEELATERRTAWPAGRER